LFEGIGRHEDDVDQKQKLLLPCVTSSASKPWHNRFTEPWWRRSLNSWRRHVWTCCAGVSTWLYRGGTHSPWMLF